MFQMYQSCHHHVTGIDMDFIKSRYDTQNKVETHYTQFE